MAHGLTHFKAQELIEQTGGAIRLIEDAMQGDDAARGDAMFEALKLALENQQKIAETLDLIKSEFDKFEEGLSKIL